VLMHLRKRVLAVVSLDQLMENVPEERAGRCFGARDLTQAGVIDRLAIDRAVAAMAPGYRSVFLLHDIHGFDHGEIATMLKCSCGNTKSQLHKARRVLRSNLSAPIPPVPLNRLTRSVDEVRDAIAPQAPTGGHRKTLTRPLRGRALSPQLAVSELAT